MCSALDVAAAGVETACDKVLTVSVAAYNVERYLAQALESCIVPSMDKLEVIVVDDGSTDGTAAIAQTYVDRYPKTFRLISKENGGYGSTVNASLAIARGKHFKLLDGDDWFDPDALERYLGILASTDADLSLNAKNNIAAGDGITGSCNVTDMLSDMPAGDYSASGIHSSCRPRMHCVTYRTDFLRAHGVRLSEHALYTDQEFVAAPLYSVCTVRVDHFPLYCYRLGRNGQSMSPKNMVAHRRELMDVIGKQIAWYELQAREGNAAPFNMRCALQMIVEEGSRCYIARTFIRSARSSIVELRNFDAWLAQSSPNAYEGIGAHSRQVKVLRASRFLLAPLFRIYNLRNWSW